MQAQRKNSPSARVYRTHLSVSLPAPRLTGDYWHHKTLRTSDELEGSGSEPQSQRRNPYFYLDNGRILPYWLWLGTARLMYPGYIKTP